MKYQAPSTKWTLGKFLLVLGVVFIFIYNFITGMIEVDEVIDRNYTVERKNNEYKNKEYGLSHSGELYEIFRYGSKHTDLQRDDKEKEIKGEKVGWYLTVYEVNRDGNNYLVNTSDILSVNTIISFHNNPRHNQIIPSLKTDDKIFFEGIISGVNLVRNIIIKNGNLIEVSKNN